MNQNSGQNGHKPNINNRFRGFLPVVVDVETAGFNAETDALLEVAAITIGMDKDGMLYQRESVSVHVEPFPGANLDQKSLDFTGVSRTIFLQMYRVNNSITPIGDQQSVLVFGGKLCASSETDTGRATRTNVDCRGETVRIRCRPLPGSGSPAEFGSAGHMANASRSIPG